MSFASLFGFLFGLGLFVGSVMISTDNYSSFFDIASFLMVVGGTIASAYMSFQARYVNIAFKGIWWMFKKHKSTREGLNTEIMRLVKWAYVVQQKGLPGLEAELKTVPRNDPILNFCLTLVTTAHPPAELSDMMNTAIESDFERTTVPVSVLKNMASNAPAFGMIGTLVGLVVMLQNFTGDFAMVGVGLALALLTTLYGILVARLVCLPAAQMLSQGLEIERFRNHMMAEGLIMLAEKRSPRYMQDRLNSYLDPANHFDLDKQMKK